MVLVTKPLLPSPPFGAQESLGLERFKGTLAILAVIKAPPLTAASTKIVASAIPATILFRFGKFQNGTSVAGITKPRHREPILTKSSEKEKSCMAM